MFVPSIDISAFFLFAEFQYSYSFDEYVYFTSPSLPSKKSTFIITDSGYGCPQCGNVYKHKTSLYKHLKYECQKEKQFQCWYCQKKFARKSHLQNHCKFVHDVDLSNAALEALPATSSAIAIPTATSKTAERDESDFAS